jgi:hypothetical protein
MHFSRCVGKFLVPFTVNLLSTPDLILPLDQFSVSAMKNRNLTFVLKSYIKSETVAVHSGQMGIHCAGGLNNVHNLGLTGILGNGPVKWREI